ncbi:MAG: S8 family serine peptidase [Anaerolineae bacterium]|nr:S8 family serine peptidase [Anaerolineae bacterium]
MKPKTWRWFSLLVVLSMLLSATGVFAATSQPPAPVSAPVGLEASNAQVIGEIPDSKDPALYIVRLHDPALASYFGGIAGLAATSPRATGASKLDPQAPASVAYLNYLEGQHAKALGAVEAAVGHSVEVTFQYLAVLNGFAVTLTPAEAAKVAQLPEVLAVYRDVERELDTEIGPGHIGAPEIWNGNTGNSIATRGEGVIIGMIDSGINHAHPAFAATDGDGYAHTNPYGAGVYKGWCVANPSFCNDKLIAAYSFNPVDGNPEDLDGHGSHTASTAGGNRHEANFTVGTTPYTITISGVAPRANIVAYKVCNPSCPGTASVAAVNSAILNDGVDVLNYSISGGDSPWTDSVDIAFLDAYNAGIFVSASAGNDGPGASTVAKTGPWNAAVAASTHSRVIAHTVDVTGPTTPPELQGMAAVPGEGTVLAADVVDGIKYDPTNSSGCTAFSAGFFTDNLALIQRGGCTFAVKVTNAAAAGATGVVLFNNVGGPPSVMGELTGTPPAVMIDLADGIALRDYIVTNPTATVRINLATSYLVNTDWEDIMAGFSSRGPSQFELVKPDYTAPGVNILAAVAAPATGGDPATYDFLGGTSMSSPHGAGAAALMVALYPDWSPAEIKSALASTALDVLLKEDGVTPANPFDMGSGLLNLGGASNAGLVFDETYANYLAANPATGGDPKTLNQPSMANYNCAGACSWTRTVKAVVTDTWTASFDAPAGMTITVDPSSFSLDAGATQVLTITADVSGLPLDQWAFGDVMLTPGVRETAFTHMPVVVYPVTTDATFFCNAPAEGFEGNVPPTGWSVQTAEPNGPQWTTIAASGETGNYTNGAGEAATASSDAFGQAEFDTSLVTPAFDLTGVTSAMVYYTANYQNYAAADFLDVDISADGGATWTNLLSWNEDHGAFRAQPGEDVTIDLSAYAGQSGLTLRYRYYDPNTGDYDWYAQIDNVRLACGPQIAVDPLSLSSTQSPNVMTTQALNISSIGSEDLLWELFEDTAAASPRMADWSDNFDSYATGSQMHGQGGWKGWGNDVAGGALTSNAQAVSAPNSVAILGASDLVHEYSGVNSGQWVYTAWQYIPTDFTGQSYFILLNTYSDAGTDNNWSAQVMFDGAANTVTNDGGVSGGSLALVKGQWVELRLELNLGADTGAFYYNDQLLYTGTWSDQVSGGGAANLAAVDLFANNASVIYYDDMSLVQVVLPCDSPSAIPWLSTDPISGTTAPAATTSVDVTFDSTGLALGTYNANLCVTSNDPDPGPGNGTDLVVVPVELVVEQAPPNIFVNPLSFSATQAPDTVSQQTLTISNAGEATLDWTIDEENLAAFWPFGAGTWAAAPATEDVDAIAPSVALKTEPGPWSSPLIWAPRAVLYDNGPLVTHPGAAPGGADESRLQATSLSMNTLGFGDQVLNNNWVADDFTVTAAEGWTLDSATFFAYQTNSPITSTITNINWVLYDGDPSAGGAMMASGSGMLSTLWTNIYRTSETSPGVTNRPIMATTVDMGAFFLPAGTYWLAWQADGTLASGPWAPPITILGQTTTGNGLQYLSSSGAWGPANDSGTMTQQGFPLVLEGSVGGTPPPCVYPSAIPWLSLDATAGMTAGGFSTEVEVTFDSTGLADGTYTGNLCVFSNDPDAGPGNETELVIVPVQLIVETGSAVTLATLATGSTALWSGLALLGVLGMGIVVWRRKRR